MVSFMENISGSKQHSCGFVAVFSIDVNSTICIFLYVAIFTSPINNPKYFHIVTINIESERLDYQYIDQTLSCYNNDKLKALLNAKKLHTKIT